MSILNDINLENTKICNFKLPDKDINVCNLKPNKNHFEKFEEQLLSSYESTLAAEGREICEEIDSMYGDNDK